MVKSLVDGMLIFVVVGNVIVMDVFGSGFFGGIYSGNLLFCVVVFVVI